MADLLLDYEWAWMHRALRDVGVERHRQEALREKGKFAQTCADPAMDPNVKLAVLAEEFGEVARALLGEAGAGTVDDAPSDLREELIQVAAVAVAWAESIDEAARS